MAVYRNSSPIPGYPSTDAEYQIQRERVEREKEKRMRFDKIVDVIGITVTTLVPAGGLFTIGIKWNEMSAGFATCSLFALVLFSFGVLMGTARLLDWKT